MFERFGNSGRAALIVALGVCATAQAQEFKFAPNERPPRARKRIEVGDEYQLKSQFYEWLDRSTHELSRTQPAEFADAKVAAKFRDHVTRMRAALTKVRSQDHPDVAWCKRWIEAYSEKIEGLIAGGGDADRKRAEEAQKAVAGTVYKLEPTERPPEAAERLNSGDRSLLDSEVYNELRFLARELAEASPEDLNRDRGKKIGYALDRATKALSRARDQAHTDVLWLQGWFAAYRKRLAERVEEGRASLAAQEAAKAAEKQDVDSRVQDLSTYFDPKTFKTAYELPITPERTAEWIKNLRQWSALGPKGLAELDKLVKDHPKYANDQRVKNLRNLFGRHLAKLIKEGIDRTIDWYDASYGRTTGLVLNQSREGVNLLAPGAIQPDWYQDDERVAWMLQKTRDAIAACQLRVTFAKEFLGQPDQEYEALVGKLTKLLAETEQKATAAYANAKMPAAASQSAELSSIAKRVLGTISGEDKPGTWKRLVINSDLRHETSQRSSSTVEGEWIVIRRWTEEYDTFQVALAEQVGADWRIVYYTFRRYTKALQTTGEWYCSARYVWNRIPPENIDK